MFEAIKQFFSPQKEAKKMNLKTGYDNSGRPFFDLNDKRTAEMFMKQAEKFAKVKLS